MSIKTMSIFFWEYIKSNIASCFGCGNKKTFYVYLVVKTTIHIYITQLLCIRGTTYNQDRIYRDVLLFVVHTHVPHAILQIFHLEKYNLRW